MFASDLCFTISDAFRVQSIQHSYGNCSHEAVSSICSCVGSFNCFAASR